MRAIASFTTYEALSSAFETWFTDTFASSYMLHGAKVSAPLPKEAAQWRSVMVDCVDAQSWARDLLPEAEDWVNQSLGILTGDMTIAQANGKAHRFIRTLKTLKRLSESADRKLSALQSLTKGY